MSAIIPGRAVGGGAGVYTVSNVGGGAGNIYENQAPPGNVNLRTIAPAAGSMITVATNAVTRQVEIGGGGAGPYAGGCATDLLAGFTQRANFLNSLLGTNVGSSGCQLFLSPMYQWCRRETITDACWFHPGAPDPAPFAGALGYRTIDFQTDRAAAADVAQGAYNVVFGNFNYAQTSAPLLPPPRVSIFGVSNIVDSASQGFALGYGNIVRSTYGGDLATSSGAVGRINTVRAPTSFVFGSLNIIRASTGSHIAVGVSNYINVPAYAVNSLVAVGISNTFNVYGAAAPNRCSLSGFQNLMRGGSYLSNAVGNYNTVNRSTRSFVAGGLNRLNVAGGAAQAYSQIVGFNNFSGPSNTHIGVGIVNNAVRPAAAATYNTATGVVAFGTTYLNPAGVGINSIAMGLANLTPGLRSVALGRANIAGADDAIAIGFKNNIPVTAGGTNILCGASNVITPGAMGGITETMFGAGNTSLNGSQNLVVGRNNALSGAYIKTDNIVFGNSNTVNGAADTPSNNIVGGLSNTITAIDSVTFGRSIAHRVSRTLITVPSVVKRGDGEAQADWFRLLGGFEDYLFSDEISFLGAPADYTFTLPATTHFWVTECGIIVTGLAALVTQPTIRFGIPATPAKIIAATLTTLLTAVQKREKFTTLLADDGEVSLSAGFTIAAAAGTFLGRFYFKGMLVEDE